MITNFFQKRQGKQQRLISHLKTSHFKTSHFKTSHFKTSHFTSQSTMQQNKRKKPSSSSSSSSNKPTTAKRTKGEGGGSSTTVSRVKQIKHADHALLRPENYIGSVKQTNRVEYLGRFVEEGKMVELVPTEVITVPGCLSVIDEIITNGGDHHRRMEGSTFPVTNLKIDLDLTSGKISITNDGNGIVVEQLDQGDDGSKEWGPTLCMGHLLTSENYDDEGEKRLVGGRNGFGAALCNIFSLEFNLETCWVDERDSSVHLFKQKWRQNMTQKGKHSISHPKRKTGYTKVSFVLDFERFKLKKEFFPVLEGMLLRRACDIAASTPDLNIYFQGNRLNLKQCVDVSKSYPPLYAYAAMLGAQPGTLTYVDLGERWKCVVFVKPEDSPPIPSFVNGVRCDEGGVFVDVVEKDLFSSIRAKILKNTKVKLHKNDIQSCVGVVVVALLENPAFQTQTKDKCISVANEFGSAPVWPGNSLAKATKAVYSAVEEVARKKNTAKNKKLIGSISGSRLNIPKYEGARLAGTKKRSNKTTLCVVEGDSAMAFARAGLGVVGREDFGVFALRGKLINCRKSGMNRAMQNNEVQALCKIIGLQPGVPAVRTKLRYGRICILTDQDVDGSHIKGLLLNFFHWLWPNTLNWEHFITVFHTPIIVVKYRPGTGFSRRPVQKKHFYTRGQFLEWSQNGDGQRIRNWTAKYYKGLATSTSAEAREYFTAINDHIIAFDHTTSASDVSTCINTAFSDETGFKALRKEACLRPTDMQDAATNLVSTIPDFVHFELKKFWDENNARVIPSAIDGLKESQRKILYSLRKKNTRSETDELRVSAIAAYTTEVTHYEHGESSLCETAIKMAQGYPGSNNINLLFPSGQFGTRCASKDAGSPRYIHSYLTKISDLLFPVANDPVLDYAQDGGVAIEPKHYVGCIPFLLANGARGIGTGVVTSIAPRNPLDVLRVTRRRMAAGANAPPSQWYEEILPWYRNHLGTIVQNGPNKYTASGVLLKNSDNHVTITELYPGKFTDSYVDFLHKQGHTVQVLGTETRVHLEVHGDFAGAEGKSIGENFAELKKKLKMTTDICETDMWALVPEAGSTVLRQMNTITDIFEAHYKVATALYEKRRLHEITIMENTLQKKREKVHYIQGWISGAIKPRGSRADVIQWMVSGSGNFTSEDEFKRLRQLPNEQIFDSTLIDALTREIQSIEQNVAAHRSTTGLKIWEKDLNTFETYYRNNHNGCEFLCP